MAAQWTAESAVANGAGADVTLPCERSKRIGQLQSVAGALDASDKVALQRIIQNTESEESLKQQVEKETHPVVARVLLQTISTTSSLDKVDILLELVLFIFQSVPGIPKECAAAAEKARNDPCIHLDRWSGVSEDNSHVDVSIINRVVYQAMAVFAYIVRDSSEAYSQKWFPTLLADIQKKLRAAKDAAPDKVTRHIQPAEAAVKALSLLCFSTHLKAEIVKPISAGDSAPSIIPYLLFPSENAFAEAVETKSQFVYTAIMCIWLLSFNGKILDELDQQCRPLPGRLGPSVITVLNTVMKKQKKEKCVRMALMTLQNYAKRHSELCPSGEAYMIGVPNYIKDMISVGMVQNLQMLQKRAFGDEDIMPMVNDLLDLLETNVEDLSSYAQYKQEIKSGMLEWSPPHTSEKFWRENLRNFEQENFEVIKDLATVVLESKKGVNLQIACHDLGEFVRHHAEGRRVWERLGVKQRVYELIEHGAGAPEEVDAVKRHALLCMQKVMVQKWEFLQH